MNMLVINCGSSSIKGQLVKMPDYDVAAKFSIGRVGKEDAHFSIKAKGRDDFFEVIPVRNHEEGIKSMLRRLFEGQDKIMDMEDIAAVGHRVVHGGDKMSDSVLVDENVIDYIESICDLAPLHNPAHLAGIEACKKLMPGVPQVTVFDNGYHHELPKAVYTYAIPYEYAEKYNIRKFGFHGIAFRSMLEDCKKILGESLDGKKIILLMLGSGTTANASMNGKSCEVSTGFTPLEGLIQSTRSGDTDLAVFTFLMKKEALTPEDIDDMANKQSGWLGMSGISSDMREIYDAASKGDDRAKNAIDVVCHRIKKYIGAYAAVLGGVDVVAFGGGVGEHAWYIREKVLENLEFLGIDLDVEKNREFTGEGAITFSNSKTSVLVTKVDEEKVIAEDTYKIIDSLI
ncbi:acetate/propionate family kinase [Alkalibacter saccharofermentans]|uniref:Acetate kinase n=1 Tax=Alkalibacter saccharofermentans DSM 14828 TaxID=1120975 RepID=A0A1M4UDZ5_9FIRM|nr:acetate/propionate family kinase [Alkalibacter saccharofermentans]SHE54975.1 acetate kinase [Alkalibacter saccharofermentans DSM 14828]